MLLDKILLFCEQNNIPLYVFERDCGIGNGTIARWKTSNPRLDSLQKVAKHMNTTVEDLLKDT